MEICLQQHAALEPYDDNLSIFDFEIYLPEEETPPSAYFPFAHFPNKILIKKIFPRIVSTFFEGKMQVRTKVQIFSQTRYCMQVLARLTMQKRKFV